MTQAVLQFLQRHHQPITELDMHEQKLRKEAIRIVQKASTSLPVAVDSLSIDDLAERLKAIVIQPKERAKPSIEDVVEMASATLATIERWQKEKTQQSSLHVGECLSGTNPFFWIRKVDISGKELTEIPQELNALKHLQELILSNNCITELSVLG